MEELSSFMRMQKFNAFFLCALSPSLSLDFASPHVGIFLSYFLSAWIFFLLHNGLETETGTSKCALKWGKHARFVRSFVFAFWSLLTIRSRVYLKCHQRYSLYAFLHIYVYMAKVALWIRDAYQIFFYPTVSTRTLFVHYWKRIKLMHAGT